MTDPLKAIRAYNIRKRSIPPHRTALLVIDMQKYFKDMASPIIGNLQGLLQICRQTGLPVFFTRHGHKNPEQDGGMLDQWWGSLILRGSPEWRIIHELEPLPEEVILDKVTYSGFHKTNLDALLKKKNISDVIIGGVMTNLCCETTARHAFLLDYHIHFLSDGTSTADMDLHLSTLKNLAFGFAHIITCAEASKMISDPGA